MVGQGQDHGIKDSSQISQISIGELTEVPEGAAVIARGEGDGHLHALFEKFHNLIILLKEPEVGTDSV